MKNWPIFLSIFLLISCSPSPNRVDINRSPPPSPASNTQVLKSSPGGVTVSTHGKGSIRDKAQQSMLRRAIKEVVPTMAGNVHDSPELKKAIRQWVKDQQEVDYEDMVKRWAFDIDTQQDDQYFLEGKVVLNHSYLKSQVKRFLDQCRTTKKCGGRLSVYIRPDASVALSPEDIKLARSFMYSLQQQFINAGFEIKKANQQKEAQYQLKLIGLKKVKSGLNVNFHFTVEALDNRAAGSVFATEQGSASASLSVGDQVFAQNQALKRGANKVGASLTHQIINRKETHEVIFYAQGDYSSRVEQQLAEGLATLYGIGLNDIINAQSTTNKGFASWSFEVAQSSRTADIDFKGGLMQLQTSVLNAANPEAKSTKAGRKWSSYDGAKPPPGFQRGPGPDVWTMQVEQLIREGKLDTPPGRGHNAYDTVRAQLAEYPGDPNAEMLLQRISEVFSKNAESALDKNQIRQARRYTDRAKTIWPDNPQLAKLLKEIANTPVVVPSPPVNQKPPLNTVQPDPKKGEQILANGKYWALLIANQNYTRGVSSLQTPLADIRSLKNILENVYGFEKVVTVEDGTKDKIVKALYSLQTKIGRDDSLLIFYAGHGEQEKGFGGKGFWIPADGMPPYAESKEYLSTWVPNSLVHDIIQASKAKHVLMVSDSCFSGTFKTSTRGLGRQKIPPTNSSDSKLSPELYGLASLSSRKAISSGDLEPVADGGGGGHSIFAFHLLKVLNEKKPITAEGLFQKMRKPIAQAASQQPQYFIIDSKTDEGGDFIFAPR